MSKPPLPSPRSARLDVHDHLVARLDRPGQPRVGDRRARLAAASSSTVQPRDPARRPPRPTTTRPRRSFSTEPSASAARSSSRSVTSSIFSSAAALTRSSGVWLASVPFARFRQRQALRLRTRSRRCRRRSTCGTGSMPQSRSAADGDQRRTGRTRGCGRRGTAPRPSVSTSVSVALAAQVSASTISPQPALGLGVVEAAHLRLDRQRSGTTFVAVPPSITPTFAVVSSSMPAEPHRARSPCAAATIALRPVLGPDARVRRAAQELGVHPVVGRRRHDQLADRRGVVEARSRTRPRARRVSNALRAAQADLLAGREDAARTPTGAPARGAAAARARAAPRRRPCCRRPRIASWRLR